jgi:tripartite-type tricarboxylate transporter receptor subunit TctC
MFSRRALLATPGALLAAPRPSRAQEAFPARPLRLVVPFTAGGAVDLTGRVLAEMLQPVLGQPVAVENRGGAAGNLGASAVVKAAADGYSLLLGNATLLAANKFLFRRAMPFDPMADLAPLSRVAAGTLVLVVPAARPWPDFAALAAEARARPGKIVMGSSGTGSVSQLALVALNRAAGIDIAHVPYRGGGPAIQDLLEGGIDMMFDVIPALVPHLRDGKLRALAVGSAGRVAAVPELRAVPGMAELLPGSGIDMQTWYAVMTTAGTPEDRVALLHRALRQVALSDSFRARMEPLGFLPVSDPSPGALVDYMRAQEEVWRDLVEASGTALE